MKNAIYSHQAPKPIGPYSQAIQVANIVYFSGQIALDPHTMTLITGDFAAEATQVFRHLQAVSVAAGGDLDAIVKLTLYLTDLTNFPIVNEVMTSFFKSPYPARTTIQVAALPKSAQIEVDAVMCLTGM